MYDENNPPPPLLVWIAVLAGVCHVLKDNFLKFWKIWVSLYLLLFVKWPHCPPGHHFRVLTLVTGKQVNKEAKQKKLCFYDETASKKQDLNKLALDKRAREELLGPGSKN